MKHVIASAFIFLLFSSALASLEGRQQPSEADRTQEPQTATQHR